MTTEAVTTDTGIEAARARAQLATTLNLLEDRLNPRKQARRLRRKHPVVFAAATAGAAVLAAVVVYAGVRAVRNR